jgi:glycosyltransferase involved in cell wall biosynthesis
MKNKIKLALLHNVISPYRLPLFEELSKEYDLTVLFSREHEENRLWNTSLSKYSFKNVILKVIKLGPLYINYTLPSFLFKKRFDRFIITECPETAFSVLIIIIYAKLFRIPVVLWAGQTNREIYFYPHLKYSKNFFSRYLYKFIKFAMYAYHKIVYSASDSFIAYSKKTSIYLEEYGVNKNKIFSGTQVMPEQLLVKPTLTKKKSVYKNKKVILYLGYLNQRKGVDLLIKAFKDIKIPNSILLIVGSGEYKKNLIQLAKNNKDVIFVDNVDAYERANFYSISDIFVLPTLHDVWGFVTNESIYYKLPAIVTSAAASSELIKNKNTGFVIEANSEDQIKKSLISFFNNASLRKKIINNINNYQLAKVTDIREVKKTFRNAVRLTYK